ncbi:MAG TPA: saccharopine dehydrogenase C-terminal domain-containing protein [Planctomycetota bacterium]|nr:saccharopine dehydrogenase C-terminal domain-containing protein [Planctomycetota bacterium]
MRSIAVIGLGNVGSLVGTLLHESGFDVRGIDAAPRADLPFPCDSMNIENDAALSQALGQVDAVVSCLPYLLNLRVARAAHQAGVHYFDLTEDVPTAQEIRKLSATSRGVMAPQCGLAPGYIGIVGAALARGFDQLRGIYLRVGALPQHPSGLLGYAFIWSPEGVVNEYLNDCEVIQDGKRKMVPAMEGLETTVIHGIRLEAFTTSGGLGTMCETFEGRVRDLDYKTLRYRGHCELMRFFFHELRMEESREEAGKILVRAKPPVNDDVVYVHAAVEGTKAGKLSRDEHVRAFYPREIAGKRWRAISWTTAASVSGVIELVARGELPERGFLKQEEIPLEKLLATRTGAFFAEETHARVGG